MTRNPGLRCSGISGGLDPAYKVRNAGQRCCGHSITYLHDIQSAIAFTATEKFARANADQILIGDTAVAAFTEVIFNSGQGTCTIGDSQATIGR